MTSARTFSSRAARLIVTTLVATIACAVVAPGVTPVKAAGAGIIDYYATLNGSSHFRADDTAAFDLTSNMTAEMWVRPSTPAPTCVTGTGACQLMNKENAYQFGIRNGVFQYALTNSSGTWNWYATDTVVRQGWQHIAFVVSRTTNTIRFYYNGELAGETISSTAIPTTGANSSGAFTIGNRGAFNEFYTGDIDEVRLYSEVRTQANIRADMYTYGTTNATNLVAYYDFNEASNSLVNDAPSAAASTNLAASGTVTWTDVKTVSNHPTLPGRTVVSFPRSYITSNGGWTVPSGLTRIDALVVAGGGGGGGGMDDTGWSGGGGGAGGLRTLTNSVVTPGSALTLAVGGGGHRGTNSVTNVEALGTNGAASILGFTTTVGGGRGGMNDYPAGNGGSGGGGGTYAASALPGNGTPGEGTAGGAGAAPCCGGGGGGGAGGAGGAATTTTGGTAGSGVTNSITGTATFYAAGGAGNGTNTTGSAGSSGGTAVGTHATMGTGSGGGGGGGKSGTTWTIAGHGGSGVVIVSYASPIAVDSTNRSMQFTGGSSSKVTVNDNNALDMNMDLTAEAWIYPTDTSCSGNKTFMGKENSYLFAVCNNFISFALRGISGSTWAWYQTTIPVSINTWAHFAFVRSGGRLTIYKNGGSAAGGSEFTTTTGIPTDAFSNSSDAFVVGGRPSCSTECFAGYVDDVRLWNYPRSASAIALNFNKRVASNVLYFPFDESGGTTVANHAASMGSTLNGTNTSATISAAWPSANSTYTAANVYGFLAGYDYHAGGAVTYAISQNGTKGTATVSASTGAFSYVANSGATGNDTFTYSVSGVNGTATHTFTVTAPSQPMASSKTFRQAGDVVATLNTATSLGYNNPSTAYTLGETVRATLSVTNGTVNLTLSGSSVASGSLGSSSVTIDGTQAQINTALNSATVTTTSAIPTRATLDIAMTPNNQTFGGRTYTWNSNGHYYTRITSGATTYNGAISTAQGMTLGGRPGYLATIQHSGENTTISGINGTSSWIGATDSDIQGTYRWRGNDTNSIFRVSPNAFRNRYNTWNATEPNGETGGENFIEQTPTGAWNDCQDSCNRTSAIVEFDPMSSRTITELDFSRTLAATAQSARNLGLGTAFLTTSTWANGEIVRATFTASAGTMSYTAGSTTLVSGASASATVTFEGSVAAMNTAFNTVAVTPTSTGNSTVSFTYGVKRATTGSYVYNAVSDHFYFSNATTATYSTAVTNAATAKWAGTSGYLVTVASESEHVTVRSLNNVTSWSGGADSVSEGQWEWNSPDAYQIYSDFENGLAGAVSYFDPSGEPNSSGNNMVVNFGTSQSHWDDTPDSSSFAQIYEFSPIDTTLRFDITATSALSVTAPTTGLSATNGAAYSLTLAASGGQTPYSYAIASGSLATGLTLNTSTGVISGTSSGPSASNSITVRATDANDGTATTASFAITNTPQACATSTTVVDNYTVERVTTSGSCNWTVPTGVTSVDAFVVGSGGGGGADGGAGGGGGAYQPISGYLVAAGDVITMTVGGGGSAGVWGGFSTGSSGTASSLSKNGSIFATANGGSGGVGGPSGAIGAGGTSTTGFAGGAGGAASTLGGTFGGVGKNGASNYFFGTVAYYGGGGAGGAYGSSATSSTAACNNAGTAGGLGGGGSAGNRSGTTHTAGCDGTANTGGGGGGGMAAGPQTSGGNGGSGIAVIRYATDPLDAYPASITGMQGRYITEDFQMLDTSRRAWVDSSGNGRSVTTFAGSPGISSSGVGANKTVRTVSGGTTAELTWPSTVMPNSSTYTLFHVARYSGASKARILQGVGGNWLSGFWGGQAGVAFHNAWLTSTTSNASTSGWVLSSDQNNLYRANGKQHSSASGTYSGPLSINTGWNGTEDSEWQVAEVIMYNRELSAAEIRQVESYLARTYGLLGFDASDVTQGVLSPRSFTAAKTGTVSTGSTSQLALTWTAPQDTTGVTGYRVEYKKSSDSAWTTFSASTSGTSTTVTGLDAATSYDTRVTPVDSAAPNRPSISATASTWGTSSIALGTMPTSPVIGTNYTLTANVTGPSSTTGTVAFMENGTVISACGTTSVLSGVASCTWNPSTFGSRNITATFSGDTSFKEVSTVSATAISVDYGACAATSLTTGRFTYLRVTQMVGCKITTLPSGVESVDVLVVGGGGGAGENVGSGGSGGGGYYAERVAATSSSELTVIVGAGGRAGRYFADTGNSADLTTLRDGGNGEATSISWSTNTFTGNGGIGGQTHWALNQCTGGTATWSNTTVPGGTGTGSGGTAFTGGTGGLDGSTNAANASAGGAGFSNSITGTSTPYGGGGGGAAWGGGLAGTGGSGGGGAGSGSATGTSGTAHTGGGGGGGSAPCAAGGAGGSGIAIIRYANVPTITSQPAAVTKASGQSHTFSVTPSATGALAADFTYQWRKDGTNISGATSSTYTISNPVVADAGTYSVVVKSFGTAGAVSTVTSSDAVLTMNKGTQTITFGTLADRVYGVAAFTISSTNSASLQNTFTSNDTSICTVASPAFATNTTSATLTVVSNGTCSVTASQAGDVNYNAATNVTQTFVVTAKALTISGMTAANKEYDRSTTATLNFTNATLNGVVSGDTVTINSAGTTGAFADKTVANAKTVTATGTVLAGAQASRYTLTQPTATANITSKTLTVTGITANNKVYDGTTAATSLLINGSAALAGVIAADAVTLSTASAAGVFADKAKGTGKTITISGLTISGADAANYTLTQPTTSADITGKVLTVSGITANNRTYDATTNATLQLVLGSAALVGKEASDTVVLSTSGATATFANKNAEASKVVTIAGLTISGADADNYTLTQPTTAASITVKELTVTGVTASSRVYDSTTDATALLSLGSAALSGKQGSDTVTLSTLSAAATFATKGTGTSKVITLTGLTISGADAANYTLTQPTTSANITSKELTVSGITANNRTYDATTTATTQLVLGSAALVGRQGSDIVTLSTASATATFANKNAGTGKAVTVAGLTISGADAANYTLTQPSTTATILEKGLTVTGITANSRVYDQTTAATSLLVKSSAALSGVVSGDTVTLDHSAATATFATKTVDTSKVVTITGITIGGADAANYTLTQPTTSTDITAKELTVTGVTASDRNYNSTTAATINTSSAAFSGIVSGDDVSIVVSGATGTFSSALFGNSKTVTLVGITSSGADAGNYLITQPTTTASIAKKTLTVIGITAGSRVYNASTVATSILNLSAAELAGIEGSDSISLNTSGATGTFSDKNVASGKGIQIAGITVGGTAASNYTLVQPTVTGAVTAKTITVTGITASNRVYNASANATSTLDTSNAALSGVESGDSVSLSTASIAGIFVNKNVGNAKAITISGITISGSAADNYSLTQPAASANVTAKTLTVTGITANNRTYDATTAATALLVKGSAALSGVESGDSVSLDHSAATASFANKNVASSKAVTIAGITIGGTDAANYSLTQPTTTANITTKTITITGITANNRTYDATTAATALLVKSSAALSGVESGDSVSLDHSAATATFANKNVAYSKAITIAGITIGGTDANNYSLTQPSTSANITTKTLTVTGITANNRVYNASDSATALLVKSSAALSGVESGDSVSLDHSAATATFANKNVANSKAVTIAGITIGGTDYLNYSLTQPTTTANITARTLTVTGITANNRVYDASTAATALLVKDSAALSGVESGDIVTLNHNSATATFANKSIGSGKTITIAGITISGTDATNYSLTQPSTSADVTAKELTVTGITANNRVYNASTNVTSQLVLGSAALVGKQGSDVVTLSTGSATATVADKNIGVGKTITIAGITISGTDVGNYILTQPTTTLSILAKGVTVTGITANNRVYDASTAATALLVKGSAALSGVEGSDVVTLDHSSATATFATKTVDTSKVVTIAGITISGTDYLNYSLTQPTTTANITAKTLTVTGITANNRVYNATTAATALLIKTSAALSGVETDDTVTLNHNSATATFADKNVGTNKTITIAGITISGTDANNYSLTQPTTSANITAKTITVTGITTDLKIFDNTTVASVNTSSATTAGIESGDSASLNTSGVTGSFADTVVANGKTVQIAGVTLTGTDAANYTVTQPTTTADMIAASAGLTWNTPSAITYGTALSVTQLNATTNIAGTFTYTPAEGTQLPAGTHTLSVSFEPTNRAYDSATETITITVLQKNLTVSGLSTTSRVYNASTSATSQIDTSSAQLNGVVSGDTITLNTSGINGMYANKAVGTAKNITVTGITIGGTGVGNYSLTQPSLTGTMTTKPLTVTGITATSRVYDRTTSATALLVKTSAALSGVEASDTVTLDHSGATATFANKTVGIGKAVTIADITIGGIDATNYALSQPSTTATISAKTLTITGITAEDRIYDATTAATNLLDTSTAALSGVITNDTVTLSTTSINGVFASASIGTNKSITISGNTISGADAGNYVLTQPSAVADITAKELTVSGLTASNKVYDATTAATSLVNTSGAQINGVQGNDNITVSTTGIAATFATKVIGTNKVITITDITIAGTNVGNYSLTQPTLSANVTSRTLTVNGITAVDREYDRTTSATSLLQRSSAALAGIQGSDNVTLNTNNAAATFANKMVGLNKSITISGLTVGGTDASNYSLTQPSTSASVMAKELTILNITADDREYDATTDATSLLDTSTAALSGVISSDAVTLSTTGIFGSFATKTVASNKTITIGGNTISGGDAANYFLTQPITSADITAKTLTITGLTASDKVYDASANATALINKTNAALSGVVSGDSVSLSTTNLAASFATKAVGVNRAITTSDSAISGDDADNYALTQPTLSATITAKPLTVTGITATNRVYDSTTSATALLVKGTAALSGVIGGDTVTLDHSGATATFTTKNIGPSKTITIAGITISGTESANYTLTQPATSASITAKELTVTGITANDRVYNATTSATGLLLKSSAALSGVQGSDSISLNHSGATATFTTKNIGPSKTITIAGITISGTESANYTLTQPMTSASVTAKTLTVSGITATNRVYDATVDARSQLVTDSAALVGIVSGDTVSMSLTGINGAFADKTVGASKVITISGIAIGSTDAGNYSLTQPTTQASIATKSLTVSGVSVNNKVYNGTTVAPLDTTSATLVGIEDNDVVSINISSITGTFVDTNVNTGITVAIAGITATGTDASNYTVTQPSSSADITQASAGLTWSNPTDAVFGASLSATQLNATALVNGTFTYSPSAGTRLNVGTHTLGVTYTPDSGNYAVAQRTVTFVVTRKSLTVAAVTSTIIFGAPVVSSYTISGLEGSDTDSGVTYTYAGTGSTTYAGTQTAPVNAGTYSVTPSAVTLTSGLTSNYSITYTAANLTINKAIQAVLTAVPSVNSVTYQPTPNEPTISLFALGGSGSGNVSYAVTSAGGICSISGATLTALLAGSCTIVATKAESANFVSRDSAAITITVNKSTQELSLGTITNKTYGDADFTVTSSATSGLAITLSASPANVCGVPIGLTVRILSNGTCTVTASQIGDSNYLSATVATGSADTRSFTIATKNLTISGTTTLNRVYDGTRNATAQLSFASSSLVGVVSGDTVTADYSSATGTFATKNVGANKPITVAGITVGGTHASRYNISMPTTLVASVTQKTVTVDGITAPTRAFNTTATAVLSTGAYNFTGIVGSDTVTLDDSAYTATYATPGVGALKVVTISDLALAGIDAQNYALTQPTLQGDILKAAATIAFASTPFASTRSATFDGTPRPLATSTNPAALSVIPSYTGTGSTSYGPSASAPTNAGGYSLIATINDVNYEGSNTSPWTINKQTVTVAATQSSLTKTFNGTTHTVPVSTSPSRGNITITYTGINGTVYNSSFAPTNAGTYRVTGTVVEANFDGFTEETLTVAKATQSAISFVSESAATYGTPHRLIAVGGAGSGTLTYVRDSGPCTVNTTTGVVTPAGTGQCSFRAERATSSNYLAASSNSHGISVAKGSQSISFTSIVPSTTAKDSTYVPTASATSGLTPVISIALGSGSVCTLNNTTVTFLGSGTCEISASQPGDSNWLAAAPIKQIVEVGKLSQAISFPQPTNYELGDPDFVLDASASSGLAVTSTVISSGSVCSVSNIGIVSILAIGSCTIEVSQAGDSVFSAASPISRTIIVQPALPSAPHIASISAGDGTVTVGYIAPSTNGGSALVSYSVIATSLTAPTISNTNCSTSTLSCTLVGLVNGSSYSINVKAFNSRGGGEDSESAEVLVPAPTLLAVQNVSGTRSNTTLDVSWMDPNTYGDGTFVQYDVSLRERGGSFGSPVRVQSVSARSTSINTESSFSQAFGVVRSLTTIARSARFTNLDPSKLYETKIVTITSSATIETSTNTASAMVMPLGNPSAPRDLNVEAPTATTARVTWATPRTDGGSAVQSYSITSNIGQCQPSSNLATSCAVSNLQSGDSLTISVRASNAIGNSVAASTTYVVPSAPGVPSIGVISVTTTAATINWRAPQSNGGRAITSYSVAALETQNPSNAFRCTSSGLSCTINGLKPAVNYTFKVRATNSVGAGAYSAVAAFDMARPANSDWTTYRNSGDAVALTTVLSLPPAPARVTKLSVSGGRRTQVTAVRAAKDANIPVTYALISIRTRTNKLLARIKVLVDPTNPTTSVSVPFASSKVRVSVQFANDIGISSGGPAGVNIAEGNTFEWTSVSNETRVKGTEVTGGLFFARGKSSVTPAMQKTLKRMAATAKARGGLVYVSGFAQKGELKSAWMLEPLARARAEAVSKYLAKIGVRQWITFHGTANGAIKGWQPVTGRQVVMTTVMPHEI